MRDRAKEGLGDSAKTGKRQRLWELKGLPTKLSLVGSIVSPIFLLFLWLFSAPMAGNACPAVMRETVGFCHAARPRQSEYG